ncbi:MAG: hypothetical protein U1F54_10305 [Burkholderiales bacterium]
MPNSLSNSDGSSFGASYVGTRAGGHRVHQFDSGYGTVAEPDVHDPHEAAAHRRCGGAVARSGEAIKSIDLKVAGSRYEHTEFEGSEAGTTFRNDGWRARLDLVHNPIGNFEGTPGVQAAGFDFLGAGRGRLSPKDPHQFGRGLRLRGDAHRSLELSLGARYDYTTVGADEDPARSCARPLVRFGAIAPRPSAIA